MGVIGPMLAISIMRALWKINYREDAERVRDMFPVEQEIYNRTVRVANSGVLNVPLRELAPREDWGVIFGRIKHGDAVELSTRDTILQKATWSA